MVVTYVSMALDVGYALSDCDFRGCFLQQRCAQDDLGAAFCTWADLGAAAEAGHAFAHAAQAERFRLVQIARFDAAAVVTNSQQQRTALPRHADFDVAGPGVLGDVRQRLLEDAEHRDRGVFGDLRIVVHCFAVAGQSGALGEIFGLAFDGGRQSEFLEDARPQLARDTSGCGNRVVDQLCNRPNPWRAAPAGRIPASLRATMPRS